MNQDEFNAVFNLPFQEASSFFRSKLNIPTDKWDDLWRDQHARGFMSAGAVKAELLADLRGAVQKSIDGGMNLKEFQSRFDEIVKTHGWSYKGGRNWRSELIWDTNVTTAYQAGRWQQFEAGRAEYLTYMHADGVRYPRPLHVSWNGITLPIGDPWIETHYPPNGWKCHCRMTRADRGDWAKAKAAGQGEAPDSPIDPKTGAPIGIDKGWDYNVGQAAGRDYRVLSDKFETLPNDLSRAWMREHVAGPAFERFVEGKIPGQFPVAVLKTEDMAALGAETQTVWFSQQSLLEHMGAHPEIQLEDYRKLPDIIDQGEVYSKAEERLIFLKRGDRLYRAGVKRTKDAAANFLLTLFETTTEKAKKQVVLKYERIR